VPIIMITGHTEKYRVEEARDAGVTEFLAKPITAHNLFARIAEIVERPRAFVRCTDYFGPDRRRRPAEDYAGPWRRDDDYQNVDVPDAEK
jgi:DNA-binding response OmpR family regulator